MASIRYYEDSQKWQAIVRKKGFATQYQTFKKRDDAEKWARQTEVDMERSVFIDSKEASSTTLKMALDRYEEIARQNKGYDVERYRIDQWRSGKLAKRAVVTLKSKDFDEYRDARRAEGASDATIRNDLAVIGAVFKHFDYGMTNPASKTIKTLATSEKRNRRLSALEQKYLMDQLEDTRCSDPTRTNRWIPVVTRFAIETAARLSEIVGKDKTKTEKAKPGLIWENVNLEKSICKLIDTKNGESRFVPLSPAAIDCLHQARELKSVLRGSVFHTTASAIKQSWQRAKLRAQKQYKEDGGKDKDFLVDFRFHDNRHEAASRWARNFDLVKLKMITGHKDARSLLRYVNPDEEDVAAIAATMAQVQKIDISAL